MSAAVTVPEITSSVTIDTISSMRVKPAWDSWGDGIATDVVEWMAIMRAVPRRVRT